MEKGKDIRIGFSHIELEGLIESPWAGMGLKPGGGGSFVTVD